MAKTRTVSDLLDQEIVNAAFFAVFDQFIAGGARKRLEIGHGARVRGQDLQGLARFEFFQCLLGLEDGERAIQPFRVEYFVCHG